MPTDKSGRFHGHIQRAMAADKNSAPAPKAKAAPKAPLGGMPMTESDGSGAVRDLLAQLRDELGGGKLMLVQHDGANVISHQIGEEGDIEGPHDHENLDALKQHMDTFLDEEGAEPSAELSMARGDTEDVY